MQNDELKALGQKADFVFDKPMKELLEKFDAPRPFNSDSHSEDFFVEITAPEFTSLCPKTGQPDYAEIFIRYTPNKSCVESKSLKLYLGSFRMFGEFHESCVSRIANDLYELLNPIEITVQGRFAPRGGIKFWPTVRKFNERIYEDNGLAVPNPMSSAP